MNNPLTLMVKVGEKGIKQNNQEQRRIESSELDLENYVLYRLRTKVVELKRNELAFWVNQTRYSNVET